MKLLIKNTSVTLGANEILKNINFEVNDQEKIAIVGRNGCGKTTLLKLISGEIEPDGSKTDGQDITKLGVKEIGYLAQISFEDESVTLEEEILKIFKPILKLKEKLESLQEQMERSPSEKVINEYIATEHNFELSGGYTFEKSYSQAFLKFGFTEQDKTRKLSEFSGGQKTKIALVKLLFQRPDILILDEPTNHLDIEAIEWLEEYLINYKNAVIFVSHDREFVNRVAGIVYEIENQTTTKYVGNYSKYVELKKENQERQQKEYENYLSEVKRLGALADRFRYKATKASMAQSKLKQIERMEVVEAPMKPNTKNFHFNFNLETESGLEVLKLDKLMYGYSKPLGTVQAKLYKGDRVAIVGGNGLGKSTLLKTIVGNIPLLGGKVKFGQNVTLGYFDQQTITLKKTNETILEDFLKEFPLISTEEARTKLGAFLFSKEDVFKSLNCLSGGERVRLELAKILNHQPNFLVLDEPTNHMDIAGKECLEEILLNYPGTLLFVSHDRYFVKKIAKGIISLTNETAEYFKDTSYEEFLKKYNKPAIKKEEPKEQSTKVLVEKKPNEFMKNKERQKRIAKLERDIKKTEEKITKLKNVYFAPENCSNAELLLSVQEELQVAEEALTKLMEEWLELS